MTAQPPDVSSCDREPIHIPGSIQPHGILLVIDVEMGRVKHAGGDVKRLLGTENWQDALLADLVGTEISAAIMLPGSTLPRHVTLPLGGDPCDISVVWGAKECLVEIEPAASAKTMTELLPKLEAAASAFDRSIDLAELTASAAREFRQLT